MTASIANGFGHALFQPNASSCTLVRLRLSIRCTAPRAQNTRVLWAAHSYNVAYSDEIGHFEYCDNIASFDCVSGARTRPTRPLTAQTVTSSPASTPPSTPERERDRRPRRVLGYRCGL